MKVYCLLSYQRCSWPTAVQDQIMVYAHEPDPPATHYTHLNPASQRRQKGTQGKYRLPILLPPQQEGTQTLQVLQCSTVTRWPEHHPRLLYSFQSATSNHVPKVTRGFKGDHVLCDYMNSTTGALTLVVQGLRICLPMSGIHVLYPVQELTSHMGFLNEIPQIRWSNEIPHIRERGTTQGLLSVWRVLKSAQHPESQREKENCDTYLLLFKLESIQDTSAICKKNTVVSPVIGGKLNHLAKTC